MRRADAIGGRRFSVPREDTVVNRRQLHTIGHSVEGRPIELRCDPAGANGTLIIGGVHPDESAAINLVREFVPPSGNPVALLPLANPDGLVRDSRYNARG